MVDANTTVYVACGSVLYLKFLLTTSIQGGVTFKAGARPPEDMKLSLAKRFKVKQNYALNHDETDEKILAARERETRWRRIVLNDLESIPIALAIFGGGVLAGSNSKVHAGAMITYTVARCLHTIVYAKQKQPHRAICWFVGVLSTLVGMGNGIAAIL